MALKKDTIMTKTKTKAERLEQRNKQRAVFGLPPIGKQPEAIRNENGTFIVSHHAFAQAGGRVRA